jgi:hypothetical protein
MMMMMMMMMMILLMMMISPVDDVTEVLAVLRAFAHGTDEAAGRAMAPLRLSAIQRTIHPCRMTWCCIQSVVAQQRMYLLSQKCSQFFERSHMERMKRRQVVLKAMAPLRISAILICQMTWCCIQSVVAQQRMYLLSQKCSQFFERSHMERMKQRQVVLKAMAPLRLSAIHICQMTWCCIQSVVAQQRMYLLSQKCSQFFERSHMERMKQRQVVLKAMALVAAHPQQLTVDLLWDTCR